mgnify:CR=1 FL=1
MDTTTGFGYSIMRTLGRLGLPLLAALALLVFAVLVTAMLALDLALADPETVVSAPLRW